jgi:hypothetical protein
MFPWGKKDREKFPVQFFFRIKTLFVPWPKYSAQACHKHPKSNKPENDPPFLSFTEVTPASDLDAAVNAGAITPPQGGRRG